MPLQITASSKVLKTFLLIHKLYYFKNSSSIIHFCTNIKSTLNKRVQEEKIAIRTYQNPHFSLLKT